LHVDTVIADLLADRSPAKARDLMLAWEESRHASWANACREAEGKAASEKHLPQIRGQLRYHLGESALAEAARVAGVGALPFSTNPPGGNFIVARVGKFALVSLTIRMKQALPRRSMSRKLLSQPNESIDPQGTLFREKSDSEKLTELAYFGCLIAVPDFRDHTVPSHLALAIPNTNLSGWISWIPLPRIHDMLRGRADSGGSGILPAHIPDQAFPKFKVPSRKQEKGDEAK